MTPPFMPMGDAARDTNPHERAPTATDNGAMVHLVVDRDLSTDVVLRAERVSAN